MKRPRLAPLLLFASVAACGAEPSAPLAQIPQGPGITGALVGESGDALPYRNVMACNPEVCYYADSDREGRFTFLLDSPGNFLIKTNEDLTGEPRRSSPMVPVTVVDNAMLDLGSVYAPTLPDDVPVGVDGTARAGDGLTLAFDPADPDIPAEVAARRIPASMIPDYPSLDGEEIIAVYALHPFAWKTDRPVGVRAALDSDVEFRTINEIDPTLSEPVRGVANGESVETPPGAGIRSLTHLVVVAVD